MPPVTSARDQLWETWNDPVRGRLRWCLLDDGRGDSPESVTMGVMTLDEDGWLAQHRHTAAEVYYVLEGEAVVVLDDDVVRVGAGSLVRLPGDTEHGIRAGGGPVRVLFVFPAAPFDDVVYRFGVDEAA